MNITLPWPPSGLNPNKRLHYRVKGPITKAYRYACFMLTKQAMQAQPLTLSAEGKIELWIDFYPPDKRHRDDDNMIASFKAGRDGIADALGINDRRFKSRPKVMDEIGGMVKVRLG